MKKSELEKYKTLFENASEIISKNPRLFEKPLTETVYEILSWSDPEKHLGEDLYIDIMKNKEDIEKGNLEKYLNFFDDSPERKKDKRKARKLINRCKNLEERRNLLTLLASYKTITEYDLTTSFTNYLFKKRLI